MQKPVLRKHSAADVARATSLFFAVRRIVRTKLAEGRKFDPSTWLRVETLKFIADRDEPKMKDVADYLSITAPSATSLVNGLARSGFVTSRADRRDKRASRLALSAKGKIELKKSVTRGTKVLSGLFAALSDTELDAFVAALERIKKSSAEKK